MIFDFTARAKREMLRILRWWETEADHKNVFAQELIEAEEHLLTMPESGTGWKERRGKLIRKWFLPKSKVWMYYRCEADKDLIMLMAVWDCRRGTEPKL